MSKQAGFNVLHRVCYGREKSVLMMKWILDVMPHLSKPDILNTEKNVNHCVSYIYSPAVNKLSYSCTCNARSYSSVF